MELTDLRMVLAIMKEGSITGAAKKLDYVQSNVTARIRKLEAELGTQLFHRSLKGVVPTEKGLLFCQYASDILNMVEEAAVAVKEPDHPCGPLRIGVVETIASSAFFIHALSEFQRKYPEVSLSLINGTSSQNYEMVLDRRLDGAFLTGQYDISPLQVAYEIQEEVFLLASALRKEGFSPLEIANATWVVFPKGCPLRAANEDWLQDEGISSKNLIEVSTLDTMLNCVRAGIGYTFLTEAVVDTDDERLRIHTVPEPYRFLTTRLVSRKEQFRSKAFAAFADCVRAAGMG
ncbi:LysR family transcriptional regulator [Paenibacillus elgii]|uniref:LysR family transcriptional regulator n=1 Tax=Paenibacillus elgii TaxID=189691 RepID=UPI0013D41B47|nr:LysR family transcriptional regulator [Paenibacillus elgii]